MITFDRSEMPVPQPIQDFKLFDSDLMSSVSLENGLMIRRYKYSKLPVVHVTMSIKAGGYTDPIGNEGMMNLLAEMLDEGTDKRSSLEISDELDYLGSTISTWTTTDSCGISLLALSENLSSSLEVLSDFLLNPSFPQKEFERVKKSILTAILQESDKPEIIAANAFRKIVYGEGHPYSHPVRGLRTGVEAITIESMKEHYAKHFVPYIGALLSVGNLERDDWVKYADKHFGSWRKKEVERVGMPEPQEIKGINIYLIDRPGAVQSQVRVGHLGIRRNHPDYYPLIVMNQILGGQFTSRINLNLREEKGYTYGAWSVWEMKREGGHFIVSGSFQSEYTDKTITEIIKELKGLREGGVTEEELRSAKEGLILSMPGRFETPAQIARNLRNIDLYELPSDFYEVYGENVKSVTGEDIKKVAEKYLDPSHLVIVIVGDLRSLRPSLEKLNVGEVKVMEPEF